jgi:hypothetical protein
MNRWKRIVAMAWCILTLGGCRWVTSLDEDPVFKSMIGKTIQLRQSLGLMKFHDNMKKFVIGIPGDQDVPDLKEMPKEFPFDYYNQTTYGVLPAGTSFQVTHVEKVASVEYSFVDVYAKVASEGKFKGTLVDIGLLTDQTKKPPTFDAKYVEEIPSSAGK